MAEMDDGLISDLDETGQRGLLIISRGTAILLLGVYIAYLIFQLKTHASLFVPLKRRQTAPDEETPGRVVEEVADDAEIPHMSVVAAGVG
jgi:Ca2+:H+ antiporter